MINLTRITVLSKANSVQIWSPLSFILPMSPDNFATAVSIVPSQQQAAPRRYAMVSTKR